MGNATVPDAITSFEGEFRFLSNFWPVKVEYESVDYPTVENAYQAAKTLNLIHRKPFEKYEPARAKSVGRYLDLRTGWNDKKVGVMSDLLHKKFSDQGLAQLLLNTGDAVLIEGNHWHDNFWGNCFCDKCKDTDGVNVLGKLLMWVRDELRRTNGSGPGETLEANR